MLSEASSLFSFQNASAMSVFKADYKWDCIITGYIASGESNRAFSMYKRMRQQSIYPSEQTLLALLKSCIKRKDIERGCDVHADILQKGLLKTNTHLGNLLVSMYVKCGSLVKAQEVFDMLMSRDVVTWTALMAGYVQFEHDEKALHLFDEMQVYGISPNAYTFACILKSCAMSGALNKGIELHCEIARKGVLRTSEVLGCTLLDMYAKCGLLTKAQEVFDALPFRDVVLWTALIAGYVQHERGGEALKCFQQMQVEGVSPNALTFSSSIKACGSIRASSMGREIHAEISRKGLLERDYVLGSAVVDMYGKCGFLVRAQEVFDGLVGRDVISWNALIAGYMHHEQGEEALRCFQEMQLSNVKPDASTYAFALNACASIEDVMRGKEIHGEICQTGLIERHSVLGNALVSMYARCGMLAKAKEVLSELPYHDVVAWTSLMSGFLEHNYSQDALICHNQMQQEGVLPDGLTFSCSLKACGVSKAAGTGKQVHAQIAHSKGYLCKDQALRNALLDMYAKIGMLDKAEEVFNELQVRDVVAWTALIAGYTEQGLGKEALNCYSKMRGDGVPPDPITFTYALKACGSIGNIEQGKELHTEIDNNGWLKNDLWLGNALVDMYAKCGMLVKAQEVFDAIEFRDLVAWTALVTGYAQQGQTEKVICIFDKMRKDGKLPNLVTFASVLAACSHGGLVEKGEMYFDAMINVYGIFPTLEHYTCMIDLLGRAGQLERAVELVKQTSTHPNIELWLTILGACQKWGSVDIARHAFEQVLLLDAKKTPAYICMYNIFISAGLQDDANRVEALRAKNHALQ